MLTKPKRRKTIVFLCTGDTCRGPMAHGYMSDCLEKAGIHYIEVKSAGVLTIEGLIPTPEAKQVMDKEGVDIGRHRSSRFTPELARRADLILGMTPYHVQTALRDFKGAKDKSFLLKEYTKSDMKNFQVTDPMGATLEVYKRVFREIKLAVDRLLEEDFVKVPPEGVRRTFSGKPAAPAAPASPPEKKEPVEARKSEPKKPAAPTKSNDKAASAAAPKKAAPAKAAAPVKKAPPAKKEAPAKREAPPKKEAPAKKAPAEKKAPPAKKAELAKKKSAPPPAKKAAPAKAAAPAKKASPKKK